MNIIIVLIIAMNILSCGREKIPSEKTLTKLSYNIDTVVIDTKGKLINLKWGLKNSAKQDGKDHLFLLDKDAGVVDIIDLDDLVLAEKVLYEKEGPNGIMSVSSWIRVLEEDKILFGSPQSVALFDKMGKVIRRYNEKMEEFDGDDVKDFEYINSKPVIFDEGIIYKLSTNFENRSLKFIKLNYQEKTSKIYNMPGLDKLPIYSILYITDKSFNVAKSREEINKHGGRIIFSSDAFSDLYVLDVELDLLNRVSYTPLLTQASKKGGYPEDVGSEAEFRDLFTKINKEISFMAPIWDAESNLYYRFSYETIVHETQSVPEPKSLYKVYLSVFDHNFKLLGEGLVKELNSQPDSPFVKDGDIWIYHNVNDELGFLVFKIDLKRDE